MGRRDGLKVRGVLKNRLAFGRVLHELKGNLDDVVPTVTRSVARACTAMNSLAMATAASLTPVASEEEGETSGYGSPSPQSTP